MKVPGPGEPVRIAVVLGSTRPGRIGEAVAHWVLATARQRGDAIFELVDLARVDLPLLDEAMLPALGRYQQPHTQRWSQTVTGFDGFVFVTPEYNHSVPAGLKNAIDFLHAEWRNKAAGFVGYGSAGGVRAVEHLRLIMATLHVATVSRQVALFLFADFVDFTEFRASERQQAQLVELLDEVVSWTGALRPVRLSEAAVIDGHT